MLVLAFHIGLAEISKCTRALPVWAPNAFTAPLMLPACNNLGCTLDRLDCSTSTGAI